jgi:HAD superfamily hydrolase (TIGR01509 family)
MNMKEIEAIIFDMDGVIIDSEPLHVQAEHIVCKQYGIDAPWQEWERFIGNTEYAMFEYIIQNFTDGTLSVYELIREKQIVFSKLISEKLQLIPGSLEFIRWARAQYRKLALTTSTECKIQQKIFTMYRLHSYFDVIITGDKIQRGKPHPEPYLKTIEALNLAAHLCVVIEDSLHGIIAAKEAGCRVVGITTSFSEEKLLNAGANIVVGSFLSLYDRLTEKGR